MHPVEHRRLYPWYEGDPPGHGSWLHRWWVRTNCRLQLSLLEHYLDKLDRRTRDRDLTPEEQEHYRKGAAMRVRIVAALKAHGG